MSDTDSPAPPATFEFLVVSLKMQVEIQLGLVHFGEDQDRPEPEFGQARHTINLLAMLEEKTKGNLSPEEQRLIGNSLTELRFRYVQAMESAKTAKGDEPPAEGQQAGG